jgi:hypothetical protein
LFQELIGFLAQPYNLLNKFYIFNVIVFSCKLCHLKFIDFIASNK